MLPRHASTVRFPRSLFLAHPLWSTVLEAGDVAHWRRPSLYVSPQPAGGARSSSSSSSASSRGVTTRVAASIVVTVALAAVALAALEFFPPWVFAAAIVALLAYRFVR